MFPPRAFLSPRSTGRSHLVPITVLTIAMSVLAACATTTTDEGPATGGRLQVVTTVAPITSIVSSIVGDRADVTGIVPEGTNSHTFEPRPSVATLFSGADVVYMNGLQLEEPTKQLAESNLAEGADIVELGTRTLPESDYIYDFSFPRDGGKPNPHLWTDPRFAVDYAELVADDMSQRDPTNAAYYAGRLADFTTAVDALDAAMRTSFATIPTRTLLTYHDAYAYFAETYDWEVIGAIQVSDFEDPTPKDVAAIIDQVRASGVPAIFGSEVFPSPVLERIGEETGVQYVDVLRDDDLPGDPGDPEHSWMGLMLFDYITMTRALGGDPTALEGVVVPEIDDPAEYPQ